MKFFSLTNSFLFFAALSFFACQGKKQSRVFIDSTQIKNETAMADKYVMIFETLEHHFKANNFKNNELLRKKEDKGDTLNLNRIKALRKKTEFVLKSMGFIKAYLYSNLGSEYDEKRYSVKKPLEVARVEAYLINLDKKGEGYGMEKNLNEYVAYLNKEFTDINPKGFEYLSKVDKENPLFKDFPDLQKRDFVESRFRKTPVVLAMAIISQLQNQVLIYETQILEALEAELKR